MDTTSISLNFWFKSNRRPSKKAYGVSMPKFFCGRWSFVLPSGHLFDWKESMTKLKNKNWDPIGGLECVAFNSLVYWRIFKQNHLCNLFTTKPKVFLFYSFITKHERKWFVSYRIGMKVRGQSLNSDERSQNVPFSPIISFKIAQDASALGIIIPCEILPLPISFYSLLSVTQAD